MARQILQGCIRLTCGLGLIAVGSTVDARAAAQDPTPPPTPQTQAPAPAPAPTPAANQSPTALGGVWKFNKELSSDTSKLQAQADNTPQTSAPPAGGGHHGGYGGGMGRGGGGGFAPTNQGNTEQGLQRRALLREMAQPPDQLNIVVTDETTSFTDDQGFVLKFTTDGKKESIDLGTAKVDSVSKWDGGILTVEMTGGNFKLTETYQLTVQGHALVVEMKSATSGSKNTNAPVGSAVPVKFIFDKVDAGG